MTITYFIDGKSEVSRICKEKKLELRRISYQNNKEKILEKAKKYYQNNREKILEIKKKYRENNKEKKREYGKKYRENNKEKIREYRANNKDKIKEYYENNKEKILEYGKKYRENNKEKFREYKRIYAQNNREKIRKNAKIYHQNNREKIREYINVYSKKRYATDPCFKLRISIGRRVGKEMKKYLTTKKESSIKYLGCSLKQLKEHLESKFDTGMTWDNWSTHGWHIDHIIPISSFDLTKEEEQKKCFHYTNLQPLWAKDNRAKGNKLNWTKEKEEEV